MAPKAKAKGRARSSSAAAAPKGKAKARAAGAGSPARRPSTTAPKASTPEERAAVHIQAAVRGLLARRRYPLLLEARKRQEAEVAAAIREAELAAHRAERRRQEAERVKAEEKRRKARELAADTTKLLEASYDGELDRVRKLLEGGLPVDSRDANGNTGLSEAASGGSRDVAQLLLERRADPNSRGEFQRTPLWRAAYAGHLELTTQLLEAGGDPRLYDEQGCRPTDFAQRDGIIAALRDWDIATTDRLVDEYEAWTEDMRLEEAFRIKQAMREVDGEYEAAKAAYEATQQALARAKAEFRKRQKEHGLGLAAGDDHAHQACASADAMVQRAEAEAASAQARFDRANLKRMDAAESCGAASAKPGREIFIPDLNNILIRDIGDRIAKAAQWPLLIDPSDCAKKMICYAGCAVPSFWRPEDLEPEHLRVALLSMIRAGGILAIDLACFGAGVDRDLLSEPFEQVRAGLFEDLLSRELLKTPAGLHTPKFLALARKEEKGRFSVEQFDAKRTAKFKFMVVTSTELPHHQLLELFEVLCVSPSRE